MKKILTLFIMAAILILVACTETPKSNARALITAITPTTNEVSFKVEVRDPDTELENRDFKVQVLKPDGFVVEKSETIAKNTIKTVSFDGLDRTTEYTIIVVGTKDGLDIELFRSTSPFLTLAQGDTEADPLFVGNVAEFKAMNSRKHYKLSNDIDFENESMAPLFTSGTPFNGTFDGADFTLSNINITASSDVYKSYLSIFGYAARAKIRNVTFDNVHIDNDERPYIGIHYVGLVVSKVSNNEFVVENITILNSSVTLRHNVNESATNRNLYAGLLGGSLQGKVANIVIKDSSLNVTQNGVNGTYSGADTATVGTYVGGVAGLIEQDKGVGISKLAVIDTDINVTITQDKKGLGSGAIYVGGIFGAYRSDRNIAEVVSNASITLNYEKHEDTEDDKRDIVYLAGLIGTLLKSNASDLYFFGDIVAEFTDPIMKVNAGLVIAHATRSSSRIVGSGTFTLLTNDGIQSISANIYNYQSQGVWNMLNAVKILAGATMTFDGVAFDLDSYDIIAEPSDLITSDFVLGGYND